MTKMKDGYLDTHARYIDMYTMREGRLHISSPTGTDIYNLIKIKSVRVVRNLRGVIVVFTKTDKYHKGAVHSLKCWGNSVRVEHIDNDKDFDDVEWCKTKANARFM